MVTWPASPSVLEGGTTTVITSVVGRRRAAQRLDLVSDDLVGASTGSGTTASDVSQDDGPGARRGVAALLVSGVAVGADVAAGRAKALMCQACHGTDGLSKCPKRRHRRPDRKLSRGAVAGVQDGYWKNETMNVVTSTLSDADVANPRYFSAINKVVKIPGE
jgi:cytochrome c553